MNEALATTIIDVLVPPSKVLLLLLVLKRKANALYSSFINNRGISSSLNSIIIMLRIQVTQGTAANRLIYCDYSWHMSGPHTAKADIT